MDAFLYVITGVSFFVWTLRSVLFWLASLRQEKYSIIRLLRFLVVTSAGRGVLFSPWSLLSWVMIASYTYVIFHESLLSYYYFSIGLLFVLKLIFSYRSSHTLIKQFLRCRDLKIYITFGLSLLGICLLLLISPVDRFLWFLLVDQAVLLTVLIAVVVYAIPEEFYWDYREMKLHEKLRTPLKTKVIVIIGDRHTVLLQEYLSFVLSEQYLVRQGPSNPDKNAIIQAHIQAIEQETTFLIVTLQDMSITDMEECLTVLSPSQIILMDSVAFPKSESRTFLEIALATLTNESTVFLSEDNRWGKKTTYKNKNIVWLSTTKDKITLKKDITKYTCTTSSGSLIVDTLLVSAAGIELLRTGIPSLLHAGVTREVIKQRTKVWSLSQGYCARFLLKDITILNHSFELELTGLSLLDSYVSLFRKKRVLVLSITPSNFEAEDLTRIGKNIVSRYDYVFLLPGRQAKILKHAILSSREKHFVTISPPSMIVSYLQQLLSKDDLVVFLGPDSEAVWEQFTDDLRTSGL